MDDPVLAQIVEKFALADACWFSSTRPDGRAHLAPIWHVWHDGCVYVVTQKMAVRTRNIEHHAGVSLALPDTHSVVILEGVARVAPEQREALNPLFKAKYNWEFADDNSYNVIIEVKPRKIIAWETNGTQQGRWNFAADGTPQRVGAES
jgi:F420H(2)-dependent biliverdin reductase